MKKTICEFLESYGKFSYYKPVSIEKIREAEEKLKLKFADEYVEYLLKYGNVSIEHIEYIELTSVTEQLYDNVVNLTLQMRELPIAEMIPDDAYVVHDLCFDMIMAWQDSTGAIYFSDPYKGLEKVAGSLGEYVENALINEIGTGMKNNGESGAQGDLKENLQILDLIGQLDDFFFLDQPETEEIDAAEVELGLKFSDEYREYVRVGGAICGGGIELTGITKFERLNVVSVTKREKTINPLIEDDMYVVEVTGIDGMIILQNASGTIFTAQPNVAPKKLFDSLSEYIECVGRFCPNDNARKGFYFEKCDEFGQDLVQRMENGLMPLLSNGKTMHLHHMGLSGGAPITTAPLVEFTNDKYYNPQMLNTLFAGFVCDNNYDRIECIKQKQNHWNIRSQEY